MGNRQEIEAEAARLLVRLQSEPDDFERSQIYSWIGAEPANAVAFAKAEAAWDQAGQLKLSGQPMDILSDTSAEPVRAAPRYRGLMIGGMIAASLVLAGAGITTKMSGSPFRLFADPSPGVRCDATPIKE